MNQAHAIRPVHDFPDPSYHDKLQCLEHEITELAAHTECDEGGFAVHRGAGNEIWFSYPNGDTLPATADGRFRGNARRVLSLSEAKGLQITPRTLPADCGGAIDYDYAQGLLEHYDSSDA